ncbi:TIGR00255 family protein [Seinonella peptonophila]|uniref:TIGR00255 family protein n=1 Tax=Seinonella peptonophila TaxID=112248 RepID=A0A1M4UWS4_9BACL|nr:YicC/YloC family endoribonuclease [Seinonella peptonophila]SHE61132.1 TIGR00255 family protein [Seinonella peptonophila]
MNTYSINSMTGYGRGEVSIEGIQYIVEIRSVNHRYLEVMVRHPSSWLAIEDPLRKLIKKHLHRGRIDIVVTIIGDEEKKSLLFDQELFHDLLDYQKELRTKFQIPGELSISDLLQWKELWRVEKETQQVDTQLDAVSQACLQAIQAIQQMRRTEGQFLVEELLRRSKQIEKWVFAIQQKGPQVVERQKKRLELRLQEWLQGNEVAGERIATEIAIMADRADVSEEITRMLSHLNQFRLALSMKEPVGRRLDFIVQEMNREMNTIGSKANHEQISQWVIESKSELEKVREQVQNIE